MVRGIKDELIDTLDFRNKLEIAISGILILQLCFLKVKPKVNKKSQEKQSPVSLLICFQIDTQYKQEMSQTCDECPQRNWSSIRHI